MPLLELDKLTMRFGGLTAVSDLDCQVEPREIFSIIGPNGAGKTTVFNAVTGIYEPTSGAVRFDGRELRTPYSWRVGMAAAVIGAMTGIVAALAAVNVDMLWRATIKRNYLGLNQPFSYAAAWHSGLEYLHGDLAVERTAGGRWQVITANGKITLDFVRTKAEADASRARFTALIALAGSTDTLAERDGKWVVMNSDGKTEIAAYDSRERAVAELNRAAVIGRDQRIHRTVGWLGLVLGTLAGAGGTLVVWNRARRTPDVIARSGIARTFQNIRLFQNMTVLENVLTGLDRSFRAGVVRMALRTPAVRREEAAATARALELLNFVGLAGQVDGLAKNLPYGSQRRLEIARALATDPRLVLLDEPAAGMNPAESSELTELIAKIRRRGICVLLIEHHMKVVMGISDRIAVLDHGVKIAEGTPAEVRANPEVIRAYLGDEEVG